MSIITPNIDASPYTGVRNVKGKVRVKTHNDAPWLDNFFNGKENCDQITGITRGKTHVTQISCPHHVKVQLSSIYINQHQTILHECQAQLKIVQLTHNV